MLIYLNMLNLQIILDKFNPPFCQCSTTRRLHQYNIVASTHGQNDFNVVTSHAMYRMIQYKLVVPNVKMYALSLWHCLIVGIYSAV